ncbi:MAG: arginine--tRNA ligase [bacterium]
MNNQNYQEELKKQITNYLLTLNIKEQSVELSKPKDKEFGDLTTNISLQVSKQIGKNPREFAEELKKYLEDKNLGFIKKIEIAGPGFLNFYINIKDSSSVIDLILSEGEKYGKSKESKGKVMVEYGQPNTHKALQIGHMKSGVIGSSIVKLMENYGYDVIKANYFGDIGKHVAKCLFGLITEYNKDEKDYMKLYSEFNESKYLEIEKDLENKVSEKGIHFVANYINEVYAKGSSLDKDPETKATPVIDLINQDVYELYNNPDSEKLNQGIAKLYKLTRKLSIDHQSEVFKLLGVQFDRQYPESEIFNEGYNLVSKYSDQNPDCKNPIFIKDQGAIIFPGEKYGLKRWVFITGKNIPSYSAKDLGLAFKKFQEYPDLKKSIILTSVEQNDYFKAVIKALELIDTKFEGKLKHMGFGWMLLGNKKTSSRSGKTIKVMDLIDEITESAKKKITEGKEYSNEEIDTISKAVGIGALKFFILSYEFHRDVNYDPEKVLSLTGFSGPYVMYGYVRAGSILKDAKEKGIVFLSSDKQTYKPNEDEKEVMSLLEDYPNLAMKAAKEFTPHKIAHFLFELTNSFNKFYGANKVLGDNSDETTFRLKLTAATATVLKNGLNLLGIETIDKM